MQIPLDFQPGVTERYTSLTEVARAVAYASPKPMKAIAADMDVSQSDLSRKLNANADDPRRLSAEDVVALMRSTGDLTPIHWLIETFHLDDKTRAERAAIELKRQLPELVALLKQFGTGK